MNAVITVRGTASEWLDAEVATVRIRVAGDGPEREPVYAAVTRTAAEVHAALAELEGGAVERWSSDRVHVRSHRPWNQDGRQLPPVYQAVVGAEARFRDPEALAAFIDRFATVEHVAIGGIEWDLSEETRRTAESRVREAAVRDAQEKAAAYAAAAGLGAPAPAAIADPGMLGEGSGGPAAPPFARMAAMDAFAAAPPEPAPLALTPDRIQVSADVDARFTTG